jgi:transcriptional regulator with XRE-family HTH domain
MTTGVGMTTHTYLFGAWLMTELARCNMSQMDLARSTGLTRQAIGNYINLNRIPNKDAMEKIARALHRPVEALYQAAGLIPSPPPADDEELERLLKLFEAMTDDEREEFIAEGELKIELREKRQKKREEQLESKTQPKPANS